VYVDKTLWHTYSSDTHTLSKVSSSIQMTEVEWKLQHLRKPAVLLLISAVTWRYARMLCY